MSFKKQELTGKVINKLTVIKEAPRNKFDHIMWECLCECGETSFKRSSQLTGSNQVQSCGCISKMPEYEASRRDLQTRYKTAARKRGYAWNLTEAEFSAITKENCYYCGISPSKEHTAGKFNGFYVYNGIDRVDNTLGYSTENVVACCTECNRAKMDRDKEEFIKWAKRLVSHQNKVHSVADD